MDDATSDVGLDPKASALEGERKQLTVLFADVKGSMDLQEHLDPEEWASIVDGFVRVLADGVRRFDGTVDRFMGDGIMALFGAPIALEDHARRACLAALHLTSAMARYAEELRINRGVDFHVRMGLNSGEAVIGRVGESARRDALGHAVGLAQRMEAIAEPGRAYLTENTARLVGGAFRLRDLGPMTVKGVSEPVGVFVLEGVRSSLRAARGKNTGLVGRDAELSTLAAARHDAERGDFRVVGIVGDAGMGKSRLCEEFCASLAADGATVRRTSGVSYGKGVPLLPMLSLMRDYFGISTNDLPDAVRDKVADRLLALDESFAEDLPLLFDFIEVPDPASPPPRLAAEVRIRRILEILRRLTARRSARELLVLLVEDLHWFDAQSEDFLARLIASFAGSRTLVLINFRPGFSAPWMHDPSYRQISLAPLGGSEVNELVGGWLGVDLSIAPLVAFIGERSGGNPFFVEEVVRGLMEDGTVAGSPGSYRLTRPLGQVRVPPSVHAVLAARIDRLSGAGKVLLQSASVIGRDFSENLLRRISPLAPADLAEELQHLCESELLEARPTDAGMAYRFWHPLTQEVAYATMLATRRRALHAAVAGAIEAEEGDRLDEKAAVLAWHWEHADRPVDAARWNIRAAGYALRADLGEAVHRWEAALSLLEGAGQTDEVLTLGVQVRIRLMQFGARAGIDPERTSRLYDEARELSDRLGAIGLRGMVRLASGTASLVSGEPGPALDRYLEAARLGEETDDPDVRAALWLVPSAILGYVGPLDDALVASDRAVGACGGQPSRGTSVLGYGVLARAWQFRGTILSRVGRLADAVEVLDRAIDLARRRAETDTLVWALSVRVLAGELIGDEPSFVLAREAVRVAEETGNITGLVLALESLASAQLGSGRAGEAVVTCERALRDGRDHRSGLQEEGPVLAYMARALLDEGDLSGALAAVAESVAVVCRHGSRVLEVPVRLAQGHIYRAAGDDVRAAEELDAAAALVHATKAVTYEPMIAEERGRMRGDQTALDAARCRYEAIGATGHARRLEAQLASFASGNGRS